MKLKFEIQLDENWTRKETEEYPVWLKSYVGQGAGLTIVNTTLEEMILWNIEIKVDKRLLQDDPNSYLRFYNAFLNQISGLKVLSAVLEEE